MSSIYCSCEANKEKMKDSRNFICSIDCEKKHAKGKFADLKDYKFDCKTYKEFGIEFNIDFK